MTLGLKQYFLDFFEDAHVPMPDISGYIRERVKPQPQMLGQLPIERLTAGPVFNKVGVDYAGPLLIKYGHVRKPTIVKSYICVSVSLTVKAVHLELVSDLTTDAFIACL